ncbi:MAG: Re/Si-specific NAD(P)(+) transhydrogenase subunit alpha [Actinobacteria bacterium]|nr:Re/Si-specific NAD(P)(+) transhydrogenase subunit alpha [Actinomycetota bacterium]MCO5301322.1 Re/Si-specific NAD(P)(+) transhydrogenase subunit alpha [Candidatus Nanopelagicales bacterium]MCB9428028.1 Re/Si-specific NAD(P)(+) transhydrogenase subunit alpha [Actinomycetota bacterium]HPE13661.1 Re/Si-specific NAD(P)(+) transhydrogenase subunit alpha [Actinomycetota bacterium]HPQ85308.1 Re/Si-specific NAD(P)(+) transhydrogenase subunit alpha [Actinomycetota bacterium]
MRIGVPKESKSGERRVAATPKTVEQMLKLGYDVSIETGAGLEASFDDAAFQAAGATIVGDEIWQADIILKINAPTPEEVARLHQGQILMSLLAPALDPDLVQALSARGVTALAMDAVPRISRAQSLDVLSSMANIAGYRAVIESANEFGSLFTGQVTAAGKVPPAKVLVVGAGVAGLAAIGTASSLGAIVRSFDARSEVAEQVESMGAEFLRIDVEDTGPSATGYAKEMGEDFNRKAAELYAEQARDVDIVITTALIPGKPAPRLLTEEMVASMKPGSVIVDMAAANGGNVAGSRPDERVVTDNGVIILGYTDLPGRLPTQASQLFGTNLVNTLKLTTPGKDGQLVLDLDDPVVRGMTVVQSGEVLWPPPPVQVSAAPAAAAPPAEPPPPKKKMSDGTRLSLIGGVAAVFLLISAFSPEPFLGHFMVFALSVVIGFYVIGNVHHALHTPLMSVTNAISGIILVGALLQVGHEDFWVSVLAFIAILVASINVFGGFTVTARMLEMFKREDAVR